VRSFALQGIENFFYAVSQLMLSEKQAGRATSVRTASLDAVQTADEVQSGMLIPIRSSQAACLKCHTPRD